MPKRFPLNTEMFPFDTEKLILINQPVADKKGCCRLSATAIHWECDSYASVADVAVLIHIKQVLLILLLPPSSSPPSKKKRTIGDDVFFFSFSFSFSFSFYFKKILQHPFAPLLLISNTLTFKIHSTNTS